MKQLLQLTVIFFLFSCNSGENKIKQDLASLMSKPINLPTSSKVTVLGKDTTINNFFESEIKMIVYTDSAGCTSCGINRMYLW